MSAPRRLLDDPSVSDALRDDLRVAAVAEPDYDAARGLRALQAAIVTLGPAAPLAEGAGHTAASAPPPSAAAASSASGTLAASSAKLTLAALLAAGLGAIGTAAWMNREPSAPASPPARAAIAAPAAPAPKAAAPATDVKAVLPEQVPTVEPQPMRVEPAATAQAQPHARGQSSATVDRDLALRDEIDHLARVKALLETEPRAAYELAQAGNRTLSSMFREERDGLSVLALDAAGEHARARALAKRFLNRHPSSPLAERIAAIAAPGAEAK